MRNHDIAGNRYGKLTAVKYLYKDKKNQCIWECKCDCGNYINTSVGRLNSGNSTSCGCSRRANLIGRRFGRLVAVSSLKDTNSNSRSMWKCKCDCGKEIVTSQSNLISGGTVSCGCIRNELNHKKGYVLHDAQMNKCIRDGANVANITGKLYKNNQTGCKGVNWSKIKNRWVAEITYKKRKYYLCTSVDINDCIRLRNEAEVAVKNNEFEQFISELKR